MAKELAKGYACETCGKWHDFPMYVYSHMRDILKHTCDCGAIHSIIMAHAKQTRKGVKPRPASTQTKVP